jgi:hypothetical protein
MQLCSKTKKFYRIDRSLLAHLDVDFFAEELRRGVGVDEQPPAGLVAATRPVKLAELRFDNVDPVKQSLGFIGLAPA